MRALFPLQVMLAFLREVWGERTLRREPESALVMSDADEALAFSMSGSQQSPLRAIYLLNASIISQTISGCKRVLDLGCGPANQLALVAEQNPATQFTGIDLSDAMLELARENCAKRNIANITFQHMDITKLDFPDGHFDGVISTLTLHHLPDLTYLRRCFREIRRVLAPNGALLLMDHGRLKDLRTIFTLSYKDSFWMPYLCNLDAERSMRAAFLPQDFQFLAGELLAPNVQYFQTFRVPLLMFLSTPQKPLPEASRHALVTAVSGLLPRYQSDLAQMRLTLRLGGMPLDPLAALPQTVHPQPAQGNPTVGQRARVLEMVRMMVKLGLARLHYGVSLARVAIYVRLLSSPKDQTQKVQEQYYERVAIAIRTSLNLLKGPLQKFGQMLGYLALDLPQPIRSVLWATQDAAAPIPPDQIRRLLVAETKKPIEHMFAKWWDLPLAAASMSQLHRAETHNGEQVCVKVLYPHIEQVVRDDLGLLRRFLPYVQKAIAVENLGDLVDEAESMMLQECNLEFAADVQEEFRGFVAGDPEVRVPKVYREYSSSRALTMEWAFAKRYYEFRDAASQEEKDRAAATIWRNAVEIVMKHGYYNADPHPGNYLFDRSSVWLIDFGFTRKFSPSFIQAWKAQCLALVLNQPREFEEACSKMGFLFNNSAAPGELFSVLRTAQTAWTKDHRYQFTRGEVARDLRAIVNYFKQFPGQSLPREYVAITRIMWGHHALMADLGATANWHQIMMSNLAVKRLA